MFKRFGLLLLTNLLIFFTISVLLNIFGVAPYITSTGLDYKALMVFCLIWGMGGAFISLQLSRFMAKQMMNVQVIDPNNPGRFDSLVNMVHQLSKQAGLNTMPEVGVYDSPDVNAFATGPSKSRALVAFSSGILQHMNQQELAGVAAHEIAHINNGDMVTMTLLQGVMNAFVMFLSRIIGFVVADRASEDNRYMVRMLITLVLEIVLGLLGAMAVAKFSRWREFHADAGSARIGGREKMIAALKSLQRIREIPPVHEPASIAALKISNRGRMALWATHPSLEERIRALETMAV